MRTISEAFEQAGQRMTVYPAARRGCVAKSNKRRELEFKNCTVRSWEWRDRDAIVRHANNRNVWINLRDRFPYPYT